MLTLINIFLLCIFLQDQATGTTEANTSTETQPADSSDSSSTREEVSHEGVVWRTVHGPRAKDQVCRRSGRGGRETTVNWDYQSVVINPYWTKGTLQNSLFSSYWSTRHSAALLEGLGLGLGPSLLFQQEMGHPTIFNKQTCKMEDYSIKTKIYCKSNKYKLGENWVLTHLQHLSRPLGIGLTRNDILVLWVCWLHVSCAFAYRKQSIKCSSCLGLSQ